MARTRKMTPRERENIEKVITFLLNDCIKRHGDLRPSNADYAEAHGIYRAARDLNFEDADVMWLRLQKKALSPSATAQPSS